VPGPADPEALHLQVQRFAAEVAWAVRKAVAG
jgi:hypothetical protein